MKKLFLMVLCLLAALSASAVDTFYINDFTINSGETKQVEINLDNDSIYTALQADIYLPEGLTIEQEDGEYLFDLTSRKGRDHIISSTMLSSGAIRILIVSQTLKTFKNNSGALLTFNIIADNSFSGPKTIQMKNVIATDNERFMHYFPNTTCTVTGGGSTGSVNVTSLFTTSCDIPQGVKIKFNTDANPSNAENKTLDWTSSDSSIATVAADGTIETLEIGTVTITATTTDGSNIALNYVINVTEAQSQQSGNPLDVNGDGHITAADITKIYNVLLGFEPDPSQPSNDVTTYTVNGVTFKMVQVDGGTFNMGATDEQGSDAYSEEFPVHQVTLSTFSIGQTEVTQELWQAVMGSNPSYFNGYGNSDYSSYHSDTNYGTNLNRPVECVSWNDCQTFITKLNQMTGKNFRLPTEAEWEYAARGGNKSQGYKYSGSNTIDDVAWYYNNSYALGSTSPDYGTHTVAMKQPNELGLYDMSGNVFESCQDWYGSYSSDAQTNPTGPTTGSAHVYRGGSWVNTARGCRVSDRNWNTDSHLNRLGLRLAQ